MENQNTLVKILDKITSGQNKMQYKDYRNVISNYIFL